VEEEVVVDLVPEVVLEVALEVVVVPEVVSEVAVVLQGEDLVEAVVVLGEEEVGSKYNFVLHCVTLNVKATFHPRTQRRGNY
jgi:hypothetical protein